MTKQATLIEMLRRFRESQETLTGSFVSTGDGAVPLMPPRRGCAPAARESTPKRYSARIVAVTGYRLHAGRWVALVSVELA